MCQRYYSTVFVMLSLQKSVINLVRPYMNKKELISVVPQYPLALTMQDEEDYFTWPVLMMRNDGYSTKILTLQKIGQKRYEKFKDIKVIRFPNALKLLIYVWQHRDAIVHAQGKIFPLLVGLIHPRSVFTTHATLGVDDSRYFSNTILRMLYKILLARFKRVIAISPYEVKLLKKYAFTPNYQYIPTAINYSYFSKPFGGEEARTKYKISKNARIIIFLGNKHAGDKTNIETLFKAYSNVCNRLTNTKLIIIGKFPPEVVSSEAFKSIQNSTILTGWLPHTEFIKIFDIAHVFVNTSTAEGNPLSVGEAAAAGIPLCLSKLPTLKSIYGNSALYHEPKDDITLADNVIAYFGNSQLRKHNIYDAQKVIKLRHNYGSVYKLTHELYTHAFKNKN